MEFYQWLEQKFIEWRGRRVGNSASVAEFGKQFGAPQQLVSSWMKAPDKGGKMPRSTKYINALLKVYGNEAYEPLGLKIDPEPTPMDQLPPDLRKRLDEAILEIETTLTKKGIERNSPASAEVVKAVMEKHGFIYTGTDTE